uniref:Uncharacterized protein n=2 Tax=Lygus hesperus TaxID=30085 RepID=A0A0A9XF51_LYGHE
MSQSDKSDPKKTKSKGKDKSDPVSEGPSAETTEEVISAVNQYFGIGEDPSTTTFINKKTGNEDEKVDNKASSLKNVLNQPTPANNREDSDPRVRPEASKVSTSKALQSQTNIRSVRDQNTGRILTRSNSEKFLEQKQQGSGNVSIDPTESVISAVTQYFGIGQDDNPAKKTTNVPRDQIVAASHQVIDNHDSPNDTKKQTSSIKVPSPITPNKSQAQKQVPKSIV